MFSLDRKNVIVTGGASGIGHGVAERFHQAGAHVLVVDKVRPVDNLLSEGIEYVEADVSKESDLQAAFDHAASSNRLDVVVNNAGIGDVGPTIETGDAEGFDELMSVNARGVYLGIKLASPRMHDGGSIINTASLAALISLPGYSQYAASKAAVVSLTRTAALELGPRGIRVNAVCPGAIRTPMMPPDDPEYELAEIATPLGRIGEVDDITGLFHFLAADESRYLTGQAIAIDGGWSAGMTTRLVERVSG